MAHSDMARIPRDQRPALTTEIGGDVRFCRDVSFV